MGSVDTNAPSNNERSTPSILEIGSLGAQSFAIFIGLSILLGRVYLILYTEKLGIPVSSINIGPIDHAIFSPDMAIMSVTFAISISLILVVATMGKAEHAFSGLNEWAVIALVLGALAIGFLMVFIPALVFTGPDQLPVGIRGAVTASGIIMVSLGLFVLASILRAKLADAGTAAARYVGYALVLGSLAPFLSWTIVAFASDDAFRDVMFSPTAELEFVSGELPMERVNIVYINDKFTFVVNSDAVDSVKGKYFVSLNEARNPKEGGVRGALPIFAIPNESIRRIKYINNQ